MVIDWTAAPEGTTHATIPNGDPRWYKLEGGKVFCWAITAKEWMPSFFLSVDEIADSGLRLYANGEQSELVMLREQREALLEEMKSLSKVIRDCYRISRDFCPSLDSIEENGAGDHYDPLCQIFYLLHYAGLNLNTVISKCEGTK